MKKIKVPLEKYHLPVFFSWIKYLPLQSLGKSIDSAKKALVVTGIAQGIDLKKHISSTYETIHLSFSDHHLFSRKDIELIHKKFDTFASDNKAIVTTEKDFMRLQSQNYKSLIDQKPWFYQKITVELDRELEFTKEINNYARAI